MRVGLSFFLFSKSANVSVIFSNLADKVRWRHYSVEGASDAHLAEDLKSLIARKVSMEVTIDRITQLSYSGELGSTFDRDGNWGQLQPRERVKAESALELFLESREEIGSDWLRSSRLNVLEEDSYILCNQRVSKIHTYPITFSTTTPSNERE